MFPDTTNFRGVTYKIGKVEKVKGKVASIEAMKKYKRVEVQLHSLLTLAVDQGEWSVSCPRHSTPREEPPVLLT
jgi:hypothetical protein